MRGSRSSRRAAAQRPVSYAELPLDDDFQVGKESGTDEAEVEGDSNGRSPNRSGKLQESLVRAKRAADSSLQTRSKRGGRGSGGGRGRSGGAASGCVAKKPGPRGPSLDAKVAAVADGGGDGAYKTKAGLGGTAVDGKAAATEDGDGKGDEEERKPRSERLGQGSSSEAVDGKRVSSRVRRAVDYAVDIRDKDEEREEAGEEKDRDEDSDEECEADWRPSPEKKMEDKEDGPRRRGKRSASEKSRRTSTSSDAQRNNPLLKQFGFRPGSRESSQANVDWDFAGPRVGGKSSSTGKHKKASTSRDGTSRKDGTWRRSGRTRGKRQTYAEPSSESADTVGSDSGDGGDEGVEDDGESSEDDIFEGKKKKPNGKSAKTSVKGGGGGGCKGRGQKGSKAAEAQTEDHRKRPREKPVASKPKVEGTRRSSREKPPVCYSERVVDMEVDKRRDAGVKAEGHESSDRQSMDSDVVVSRGKKSSTAGKAKRQAATSPSGTATAVSESRQKDPKRRKRSKSLSTCDDDDYGSDVDEESEEDEYDQDDGDSEEVKPKVASRTSRGDGRNKGKGRATSADYVESENSSGSEDYEDDEEEKEPLRVDKIVARKKLLPAEWRELCKDMNTAEVKAGSMWGNGSRNGGNSDDEEGEKPVEKYLIKWSGMSYLHVSWETLRDLVKNAGKMVNMKVRRFREREFDVEMELERGDGEYFDPSLTVLDRVLDVDEVEGEETRLLVKWLGAPYSECTYELVRDLENAGEDYVAAVEAYRRREDMSKLLNLKPTRKRCEGAPDLDKDPPVFKNGGALRDYQREGVRWMVFNWLHKRGSILADEMGLGKTLQTVTFLRILHVDYGIPGPFLIVAPLSTVTHWQREFQNWSDMNTVVFHGYQDDRDILDEYEMEFSEDKERKAKDKTLLRGRRIWKPTVVVTTPELCIKPDVSALLGRKIHWDVLVVDEAHRLKNNDSKLNSVLKDYFTYDSTLLLTGTPLQNNTEELWTLLNLVDPPNFKDKDGFVEMYGDLQQAEDVAHLQKNIKPYLLRRMKEDVEKAVPPKEETIIEVELTEVQKQYYRAIYEQNTTFLLQGKKRPQDGPSLMNLAMQLRKCCNHPYLIDGVEDAVRIQMGDDADSKEHLARHSGKLVLLDKLLPRLKEQGHRVLIFSQFKIMLNILEDYLIASEVSYGRIDGSIQGHVRQKAIDNFQAPNSDMLVMLLSTKAGGVGITLTAADTCIIYDSDWNPQVYRLLVAKTYEMHMFKTASKKLGLDQAVLSGSRPKKAQDKAGPTAKEVEMLLKHGAYDVFQEGGEGAEAGKKFCEDSIDAILSRATVVNHSAEGGQDGQPSNSFSKASFVSSSNDASEAVDMNDPEFWTKCVGLTVPVEEEEKLGRRKARSGKKEYRMASDSDGGSDGEDRESEFEDVPSDDSESTLTDRHLWSQEEISNVAGALFLFGYGRWEKIRDKAAVGRALGDVTAVGRAMVAIMLQTEAIANAEMNMKKTRENKVCNKLFAMVISRERRERLKKEAAKKAAAAAAAAATSAAAAAVATTAAATVTSADSASTTTEGTEKTPSGVETPPVTVVEKPLATVTEKPAAADVAGGGQAAAPTPAATNPAPGGGIGTGSSNASGSISEGGSGGETSASIASISMTLPIIGSLAERATDEERKIAAASVCPPSESEFQANVKTALSFLLNKHHASRRALRDMRMAMAQSQGAKRKALAVRAEALAKEKADAEALVQAKAEAFGKAKAEALAQAKAEVAAQEKAGAAAERKSDSAAQANAEAAVQETGKAESKDEEQRNDEGKQEAGAEAGAGAGVGARVSDGDKAVGRAKAEVTKDGEKVDGKEERGDAVEVGAKAVAMASHAAMPGDGSSSGSGGSGGAPSATSHAAPAKKEEPVDDDLAVLNKVWKPRHVGPDSKFRSQNLVRISAKLSLLDEMEDLRVMMDSPNELQAAKLVVEKLLPFTFFSSGNMFGEMMATASGTTTFPAVPAPRVKHLLVELYCATKKVVVGNMAEEVKRAPLPILHHVLDIWTDKGSQRKFLANHVYYVTANFELKDVLLSIKRYSPDQGALGQAKASEVLLEIFKSILREFGLEPSNLASGTTDSGSDIKAVSINGLWKQFGVLWNWCFCHLMVKTAEQAFGTSLDSAKSKNPAARDLLKTVIKVVETLSKSSNLRVKFEDLQVDLLGEVFKVKHAPQRWLSLTRTLERIIRLWHVLRRLYSDEGKNFPLEEGDNKDGILQLYSLLQPLSSIMRDGQYGGAPMTAEIFMKFAKLKTKVLDMSAPLRDIPALGEDGLPNPGEQRKALPSDMVPADKLHPMTTLAREKLCRALMSRLYERVWDEESPDPSFFCDAACLLTPPFIEGRHVSAMRLTAEDANYLPDGSKVIAPTADLEVTAKLDGAWTEIRKRTVEAVKTEQDRAGGSGAGGGGGPFKRARTSGGRSARRSTDPDEFADFGRTAGFQESGQDDVVEQEVGGEIMRYKGVFMKPQDPPFGIMMHSAPEGWRANHDRWLVQSACDLGWFTSMQKKRAAVIQDDPNNNWPGLISMPDHVFLGRRLKALVAKFRDDRRQALREAEKAREREQAKERRKLREENEARQKRDREVRQAQLVEERASLAVTAAAKASVASKERPLAPQPRDNSERANSVAEAQLQRLLAEQRGRAAVATAAAAAAAVRTGTVAPGGSGDKLPPLSHSQQQQGQMRVFKPEPTMVYTLPPNVDPSASNVRTVYDESGKLKGYMVWPSEDAAQATTATVTATTTATTATMAVSSARPEDRIRGLAGIVVPGVNGNPATANASAGVKPLLAGAEPPPPLQQQNQHQQQRGFERAFGGRPESGGVDVAPWGTSNPGPPAMVPAVSWNGHEGGVGIGAGQASASGPRSSLCVPLPVLKNNSTPAALATVNGFRGEPPVVGAGRGGAGAADLFKASVSTCDAAASTEDGILLRHAIHNLGVPISMLENYDSNNAVLVSMAASESPLRRALDMSWLKLANGNDSLSPSMAESIGVHLLSKAAAVAKDSFGLRLPRYDYLGPIPEKEKALLTAFLQSAAKATQLRASLLRYTQLREIQSFAARLVRAKELRNPTMPVWWKPELHDAHLLVASCIYGSSSDYGVQRAMREITAVTIRTHGSTVSEEKENSKIESAYALPGCATAEPMSPLCSMSPPLTAAVAKTRVKHLHSAAFVQAKRLHSSATVGNGVVSGASSNSIGSDRSVALGNGMVVAAAVPTPVASASPAPVIVINDNASVSVSGGEGKACLSGVDGNPTEEKVKMKRPPPEDVVEVLDLCGDDEDGIRERIVSESPMKKLKATPPPETAGETVKEAVVPVGVAAGEAVPPAASTPTTVPALSVSSTGSDSGSKGGAGEGDAGESPKGQKKGTAEAAVVAKEVTGKTKAGGTLDSFWNSP